jgi:hypothetical protein
MLNKTACLRAENPLTKRSMTNDHRNDVCWAGAQTYFENPIQRDGGRAMIEMLSRSTDKVFGMKVSGKLLHQDYQQFVPRLERLIQEYRSIRCLIEMTDVHGIELRALWDEIKFDVRHARQIDRCAVVGDRAWEAWMTRLSRPIFFNAEIRFFDVADREKAWAWIEQGV